MTAARSSRLRAAVVVYPGTNSDAELVSALADVLGMDTHVVWHRETTLPAGTDLVALPGGFSFGDYLRPGAIARVSPISAALREHAARGGYLLGICNGFQILTELGLLPGALLPNAQLRFESRDVFVRAESRGPFTDAPGTVWRLPIAHAGGRFYADPETRRRLDDTGAVALRYCLTDGRLADAANPNGSLDAIAGLYGGPARNVLGLMPHPERRCEPLHGGTDGLHLFDAVARACAARRALGASASAPSSDALLPPHETP